MQLRNGRDTNFVKRAASYDYPNILYIAVAYAITIIFIQCVVWCVWISILAVILK